MYILTSSLGYFHAVCMYQGSSGDDGSQVARFGLSGIDLTVRTGQVTAVVGPVGAGKSSLVESLLGQMLRTGGGAFTRGSVAYVAQAAWIFNASLQDNILFGKPYDEGMSILYRQAFFGRTARYRLHASTHSRLTHDHIRVPLL